MQKVVQGYFSVSDFRDYLDAAMDEVSKLPHQNNRDRLETVSDLANRTPLPALMLNEPQANAMSGLAKTAKIGLTHHKFKPAYSIIALITTLFFHYAIHKSQTSKNYVLSFKGTPWLRYNYPWIASWFLHLFTYYSEMVLKPSLTLDERYTETVNLTHFDEPSVNNPYLIQLANRLPYDELLNLNEIPQELFHDSFLSQLICPISKKPIRYPVSVMVKGQLYFCDRSSLLKYIPALCNWTNRSDEQIPGLNCVAKDIHVISRTNKIRLDYINWRLEEISKVLAKIQGKEDSAPTFLTSVTHFIYQKFSWAETIRRRIELYDKIDERFEKGVNLALDNSKCFSDRAIACITSAFTFPALAASIAGLNLEVKILALGHLLFGGHTKSNKLLSLYPDMIFRISHK